MNVFLKLLVLWLILTARIPSDHMTVCAVRDTKPSMIPTNGWRNAKVTGDQQTLYALNDIVFLHFLFPGKYEDKLNAVIFGGAYIRNMAV